jgi:hypothetical protein
MNIDFIKSLLDTVRKPKVKDNVIPFNPEVPIPGISGRSGAYSGGGLPTAPAVPVPDIAAPPVVARHADQPNVRIPVVMPTSAPATGQYGDVISPDVMPDAPIVPIKKGKTATDRMLEITSHDYSAPEWEVTDEKTGKRRKTSDAKRAAKDPTAVQIKEAGANYDADHGILERIGGALGGWAQGGIAGAVQGATDRHWWEKQKDRAEIEGGLGQKAQLEQGLYKSQAEQGYKQAQSLSELAQAEKYGIDAQNDLIKTGLEIKKSNQPKVEKRSGKYWLQFPDGKTAPLIDPVTKKQAEELSDRLYEWTDPSSGKTVQITGGQLASAGATIASGNAQRTQAAAIENTNNAIEVAKANVDNLMAHNKQVADLTKAAVDADPTISADPIVKGLRTQFDAKQAQLDAAFASLNHNDEEAVKRANKLQSELADLSGKLFEAVGKTDAGRAKAGEYKKLADELRKKAPPRLTAPKVTPSIVKPVAPKKDPLGLFR